MSAQKTLQGSETRELQGEKKENNILLKMKLKKSGWWSDIMGLRAVFKQIPYMGRVHVNKAIDRKSAKAHRHFFSSQTYSVCRDDSFSQCVLSLFINTLHFKHANFKVQAKNSSANIWISQCLLKKIYLCKEMKLSQPGGSTLWVFLLQFAPSSDALQKQQRLRWPVNHPQVIFIQQWASKKCKQFFHCREWTWKKWEKAAVQDNSCEVFSC